MSEQPVHSININRDVLSDFTDVHARKVHRTATGRDIRQAGATRAQNGHMGGKMRRYAAAGLVELGSDGVWVMTPYGEQEETRARDAYAAASWRVA